MRKAFVVFFAVLVVFLVAADRISLLIAESQIASRVQKSQGLDSHPRVAVKGFPFLTQVIGGRYNEVDVTVSNVTRNGLTVDRLTVRAHGVSVPLSKVLAGSVTEVPVDRADAQVTLRIASINAYLASQLGQVLRVSATGDRLKLTGTLPFPPRLSLSADATVDVTGSSITLRPASLDSLLAKIPTGRLVAARVEQFFTVRLGISQLPFGISLQRASVAHDAVVIDASATGLTLRAPSG